MHYRKFYDKKIICKLAIPWQTNETIFQLFPAIKESSIQHGIEPKDPTELQGSQWEHILT